MYRTARPSSSPRRVLGALALAIALASPALAGSLPDLSSPLPSRPVSAVAGKAHPDLGTAVQISGSEAAITAAIGSDRVAEPALVSQTANWSFESNLPLRMLGLSLTPAGDVNGDGFSDFVALADANSFHMSIYLFLGSASGPALAPGFPFIVLDQPNNGKVVGVGDVNGDGRDDILMFWFLSGSTRVYFGAPGGIDVTTPNSLGALSLITTAAPAGDVNGDGFGDVIFGFPDASGGIVCAPSFGQGTAEVWYGSSTGLHAAQSWRVEGCVLGTPHLGASVAGAGDVNGDGFDDIIIGAPGAAPLVGGNVGMAFVFHGSINGMPHTTLPPNVGRLADATQLAGHSIGGNFGWCVSPAGDLNGDGFADIAVGAPDDDDFGSNSGQAFIFPGSAAGVDTARADVLFSASAAVANAEFGSTLTPAGDTNGDGRPDMLIGEASRVNVGESVGATLLMLQALPYAANATKVMTAGDVNGDGLSDVIAGDFNFSNGESTEGRLLLHFGTGATPSQTANWTLTQTAQSNPNLGWSVSSAGDVNGDGIDDVLVGSPTWSDLSAPGDLYNGLIQLFFGHATGLSTTPDWWGWGASGDQWGVSVASADVNGDGFSDIIMGAHTAAGGLGQVILWYGSSTGPAPAPSVTLTGFSAGSLFGGAVAGAGDVNGDGYPDIMVGAPMGVDPGSPISGEGRAYVYRGSAAGLVTTPIWSRSGGQLNAHLGASVAGAGDINADGFADVVVGVPDFDGSDKFGNVIVDGGRALMVLGSTAGPSYVQPISGAAGWRLGASVAGAGDVNGDGFSDVIVGAPSATNTLTEEGAARVVLGNVVASLGAAGWTQFGGEALGDFGSAVSSAGDVDGDGLSDVLVGAVFQEAGGAHDQGAAYIFRGPLPASAPPFWSATSGSSTANMGHSLANAGDVNGDGWSDLIFGEPGFNGILSRQGLAQVRLGSRGGALFQIGVGFHGTAPAHMIQPGCLSDPGSLFLLSTGRSAAGRTKVRLQYKLAPTLGLAAASVSGITAYSATGTPGVNGSLAALFVPIGGLVNGVPYAWSARTLARSVYFPTGPWRSPARSGRLETDFRVPGTWVDVAAGPQPGTLMLAEAHPNPMRASSTISFSLTRTGVVSLSVLDVQGRHVRTLAQGSLPAGQHRVEWNGLDGDGRRASAGVYLVRLEAEGHTLSSKIVRVR